MADTRAWVPGADSAEPPAIPPTALDVSELHPTIAARAKELIRGSHYDSTVREGAIALGELLRERSGLSLDGADLAGATLGGKEPKIVLADLSTREGRGEQDGWAALAEGCFRALRNPIAHHHLHYDRVAAMEALATMSAIARRLDAVGEMRPPSSN